MNKPKMILFDYGGTLLYEPGCDFLAGERKVFEHITKNPRSLTPEDLSRFNQEHFMYLQKVRNAGYEAHELQMMRFQYEYNEIELDISYQEAEQILWDNTSPMTERARTPNVMEMLECLGRNHIRSGVISNIGWSGYALRRRMNILLPGNEFEFVIASSEYGVRKPDKRIFELALKKAGLPPEEVWYCGDTFEMDIAGAHNVGIFPVYYQGELIDGPERNREPQDTMFAYASISDWMELIEMIEML